MDFFVYHNWTLRKAIIHKADCPYCNAGAGIHPEKSDFNSNWLAFVDLSDAEKFIGSVNYSNRRACKYCLPDWEPLELGGVWSDNQSFTISHADNSAFETAGLRAFFEYRKLGIHDATKGAYDAHVIRAVPGMESPATWHTHDLDFQMVYILKGWVVFEYEGAKEDGGGEHMLRAGSCVLQPPGIRHREVRHSDDLELLEIVSPADFTTHDAEAP